MGKNFFIIKNALAPIAAAPATPPTVPPTIAATFEALVVVVSGSGVSVVGIVCLVVELGEAVLGLVLCETVVIVVAGKLVIGRLVLWVIGVGVDGLVAVVVDVDVAVGGALN